MALVTLVLVTLMMLCQLVVSADKRVCGTLYDSANFKGNRFVIENNQRFSDLQGRTDQYAQGWQRTNSYAPESDCILVMCEAVNFEGRCYGANATDNDGQEFLRYNTRSVKCECNVPKLSNRVAPIPSFSAKSSSSPLPASSSSSSSSSSPAGFGPGADNSESCQCYSAETAKRITQLEEAVKNLQMQHSEDSSGQIVDDIWERLVKKWDKLFN